MGNYRHATIGSLFWIVLHQTFPCNPNPNRVPYVPKNRTITLSYIEYDYSENDVTDKNDILVIFKSHDALRNNATKHNTKSC